MPWTGTTTRATGYLVTAAVWNAEHVDNMTYLEEVAYTQFTANVSVTGTGDVDIVSAGALTYEAVPHLIEFWCPRLQAGSANEVRFALFDGATEIGRMVVVGTSLAANGAYGAHRLTPTAASHTYKIVGYNLAAQTSTALAGAGGTDLLVPGFIRITRIPT